MATSRADDPDQRPAAEIAFTDVRARQLLERMQRGDPSALDALLGLYWQPLVDYVFTILDNMDAAEDVVQDIFVRLWHNRTQWSAIGSIRSYLYRGARNRALNEQRRLRIRSEWVEAQRREDRRVPTPADDLDVAELLRVADDAIRALPPRQREVFLLSIRHNLPYRDIQQVMGISHQTVANYMSAALRSVRNAIGDYSDVGP